MSIHAQLSDEAAARLHAQRRNSTVSSIVIAFLSLTLIGLVLAFIFLEPILKETPVIVGYTSNRVNDDDQPEQKKMTNSIDRKPSSPSASMAKVIAANTFSPTAVPVPEIDTPNPSADFGDGDDFGDGWGTGGSGGGGGNFGNIPASMRKRCTLEDRLQRLEQNGGNKQCEEAVVKALDWMQKTQDADGAWGGGPKGAMTGLALLAYLAHCETPLSEKYGDTVLKAITYLIGVGMKQNGRLTTTGSQNEHPYEHAIATYALAESYTFCKQLGINVPKLGEVTQKAGQYIIDKQHVKTGGWDYGYASESDRGGDISIAAWQVQALKACKYTGIDFRNMKQAVRKALAFFESGQLDSGGFGYVPPGGPLSTDSGYCTLTGAGMLAFQMWDKASAAPVRRAESYIRKNSKFDYNGADADLYGHYYESQAMIARGGAGWKHYNNMFRDQLLNNQADDGSWKTPGGGKKINSGPTTFVTNTHYRTCLNTLMLEVYYRFLPGTGETMK